MVFCPPLARNCNAYQAVPSGLYVCFYSSKSKVQLQFGKLGVVHSSESTQGAVRQSPQPASSGESLTAHLRQSVDQPWCGLVLQMQKKVFVSPKCKVVHIKAPFQRFFCAVFCVLWAWLLQLPPLGLFLFLFPDGRAAKSIREMADHCGPVVPVGHCWLLWAVIDTIVIMP